MQLGMSFVSALKTQDPLMFVCVLAAKPCLEKILTGLPTLPRCLD